MAAFNGALAILLLIFGLPSLWAPGPAANRKANQTFRKGQYDKALDEYHRAMEILPGERVLSYNSGTSLIKQKKYDEALKALMTGAADSRKEVRTGSLYNSGNALFDMQKYPEALSAYREAVLQDSKDMNAKFNYELAQYRLKKQQEQQKDQNQKGGKDQQDQQQQNQQNQNQQNQNQPQNQGQEQQQKKPETGDEQKAREQQQPVSLLSKQEAERLLDALKANETEMIKARLKSSRKRIVEKDW